MYWIICTLLLSDHFNYQLNRMNGNLYRYISFSVYMKWKLLLYYIAWLCLYSLPTLHQLCLWPCQDFFKCSSSHVNLMNPRHLSITIESLLFKNRWHDNIFMKMLSCQGFINNNNSIVILKCPNRMSHYYFNKELSKLTCDEEHLKKSWQGQR